MTRKKGSKKKRIRLGDLQLRILQVLWNEGEASVEAVRRGLGPEEPLAYTTVATMLQKMEARELVARRMEGRRGLYRPVVASSDVRSSMVEDLVDRVFDGNLEQVVAHLLTSREVSGDELERIARAVAERRDEDAPSKPPTRKAKKS